MNLKEFQIIEFGNSAFQNFSGALLLLYISIPIKRIYCEYYYIIIKAIIFIIINFMLKLTSVCHESRKISSSLVGHLVNWDLKLTYRSLASIIFVPTFNYFGYLLRLLFKISIPINSVSIIFCRIVISYVRKIKYNITDVVQQTRLQILPEWFQVR